MLKGIKEGKQYLRLQVLVRKVLLEQVVESFHAVHQRELVLVEVEVMLRLLYEVRADLQKVLLVQHHILNGSIVYD